VADYDRGGRGPLTLAELAEASEVPARTILHRAGAVASPTGGRAACYGEEHLEGLSRIRARQEQGQSFANGATPPFNHSPKRIRV